MITSDKCSQPSVPAALPCSVIPSTKVPYIDNGAANAQLLLWGLSSCFQKTMPAIAFGARTKSSIFDSVVSVMALKISNGTGQVIRFLMFSFCSDILTPWHSLVESRVRGYAALELSPRSRSRSHDLRWSSSILRQIWRRAISSSLCGALSGGWTLNPRVSGVMPRGSRK